MKFIQSIFLVFALALISPMAQGQTQNATNESNSEHQTEVIKVKGVTCSADLNTLAENVRKLKGVVRIEPLKHGATSTFEVEFDPEIVEFNQIVAAIENTGGCKDPNEKPYRVKP